MPQKFRYLKTRTPCLLRWLRRPKVGRRSFEKVGSLRASNVKRKICCRAKFVVIHAVLEIRQLEDKAHMLCTTTIALRYCLGER